MREGGNDKCVGLNNKAYRHRANKINNTTLTAFILYKIKPIVVFLVNNILYMGSSLVLATSLKIEFSNDCTECTFCVPTRWTVVMVFVGRKSQIPRSQSQMQLLGQGVTR